MTDRSTSGERMTDTPVPAERTTDKPAGDPLGLARTDLLRLRPYTPGAYEPDCVRLNANESPWRAPGDTTERGLNRYPPPRPDALRRRLAEHYSSDPEQMLVTRGSSEAIDVLIRGFCAAGRDRILICPPTFDMYRVYATVQGAGMVTVPLIRERDFALDTEAVLAAVDADPSVKLVFLCSPNNPTGQSLDRAGIETLCEQLSGRALVVIDEAYHEFAEAEDFLALRTRYPHVVLLRTLSKFLSLAGVRCGTLFADPRVIGFLQNVLPPYTFPTPSIELVLKALSTDSLEISRERVALLKRERERLADALRDVPQVVRVWPSDANFVLVQARDGARFRDQARSANILVRLFPDDPALENCVRITVGRPEDNDRLLQTVSGAERVNHG